MYFFFHIVILLIEKYIFGSQNKNIVVGSPTYRGCFRAQGQSEKKSIRENVVAIFY